MTKITRRGLFRLAGGALGAALFIPSHRLELGVPKPIAPPPLTWRALNAPLTFLGDGAVIDEATGRRWREHAPRRPLDMAPFGHPYAATLLFVNHPETGELMTLADSLRFVAALTSPLPDNWRVNT